MEPVQLDINGRVYEVQVDRANWTLLHVLREVLGLTGTKCGCSTGDCGACKVLLDGAPVNACTVLARKAAGKKIVTIEGLAEEGTLHPIQRAFVEAGAVQCGFCTPGMIMSAKALLDKNPDPTREEVALALDNNLCRCTGYQKIIEAVLSAARLLRGEHGERGEHAEPAPGEESTSRGGSGPETREAGTSGPCVGRRLPVRDAELKASGRRRYTGDLRLPGMLHAKMLWSPVAHARIKRIDTSRAEALPGVRAVATCFNAPARPFNSALRYKTHNIPPNEYIFPSVVRYVGDRVAAVAAGDPETAAEAVRLIEVEYEELPAVFDPEEALQPDAPQIHEGGNLVMEIKAEAGDVEAAFAGSDLVLEERYTTPAVHHYAIEPHVCLADWDGRKLTVWTPGQNIFAFRVILSEVLDLPVNRVRVIKPPVGGAFGGKLEAVLEPVVAFLAMKTGRPVRMELSRKECMVSTRTRHAAVVCVKAGARKDGALTALDFKVVTNTGAYASSALNVLSAMSAKGFLLYRTPNVRFRGYPAYTNTPVAGAMRGYGSPQLFAPLEVHLDRVAGALGLDPLEFRLKNLVHPGDPNPRTGKSLGNCRIIDCVGTGAALIGWEKRDGLPRTGRVVRGLGMACGVHGNGVFPVHTDLTTITLKMLEDGGVVMFTGTQDLGQGATTAFTQIAGQVLGVDPASIEVVEADTELTSFDLGTYASRGIWVSGRAAQRAAEKLLDQVLEEAALLLRASKSDLAVESGWVVDRRDPGRRASLGEVVVYAQQRGGMRELIATESYQSAANAGSYGAHFAEVEVETDTGRVRVLRCVAAHDIGKAINPLAVEGQIQGGIQMGLGYSLSEELIVDPATGKVANAHPKKYSMFKAKDMPEITIRLVEEGEPPGPFGAKSIGEVATVPVAPAVINAVNHALGTNLTRFPAAPDRILAELRAKGMGGK